MMHDKMIPNITKYLLDKNSDIRVLNVGIGPCTVWLESWFLAFNFEYHTAEIDDKLKELGADVHFLDVSEAENGILLKYF